jgi:hypothetical protein
MITACGRPSEQTLVDQFPTVRPTLDTLRAMAEEDTSLVRIARDFVDPPSPTFTTARWNRYRQLLERLHSEAGLTRMPDHVVDIAIGTSGLAVSGSSNGYIYFPTPPSPAQIRPTLADTPAGSTSYRLLSGGWYLYMRR